MIIPKYNTAPSCRMMARAAAIYISLRPARSWQLSRRLGAPACKLSVMMVISISFLCCKFVDEALFDEGIMCVT